MAISRYGLPLPPIKAPFVHRKAAVRFRTTPFTSQPPQQKQPGKPPQKPIPRRWTNNPRDIMSLISIFAHRRQKVMIRYVKVPDSGSPDAGAIITRMIEPYSIRMKFSKKRGVSVRYLYGWDIEGPTLGIHSFVIPNIKSATGMDEKFTPRYIVEF